MIRNPSKTAKKNEKQKKKNEKHRDKKVNLIKNTPNENMKRNKKKLKF